MGALKDGRRHGLSGAREFAVIATLLSVYGLVIFLSPDPEWVVWAGQMSVGVIDPSALPPPMAAGAVEALHTASTLGVLGLLAAAVLAAAAIAMCPGWLSRLFAHAGGGHAHGTHGAGRRD